MNSFISSMRLAGAGRSTEFSEEIQPRNDGQRAELGENAVSAGTS
jgi:hypothetical protein